MNSVPPACELIVRPLTNMNAIETWLPPNDPDPHEILCEGVDDTRGGRYEIALSKFVWFHEHALAYDRHLSAVRLSFALSYWHELAQKYPAALEALYAARDRVETAFRESGFEFNDFQELAALNRTLNEGVRTVDAFKHVADTQVDTAQRLYHVAEPFLVENGDYSLCGRFLDSLERVALAARCYEMQVQLEESRPQEGIPIPKLACKRFTHNIATLVALLVRNDRLADAQLVVMKARETLDDADFQMTLDTAITGVFPNTPDE